MTHAVASVLSAENTSLRDLFCDALGVAAIVTLTGTVLWLPAILSA